MRCSQFSWFLLVVGQLVTQQLFCLEASYAQSVAEPSGPVVSHYRRLIPPPQSSHQDLPIQNQTNSLSSIPARPAPLPRSGYAQQQQHKRWQRQLLEVNSTILKASDSNFSFSSVLTTLQFVDLPEQLPIPATTVKLKFPVNTAIELKVNDMPLDLAAGQQEINGQTVIQTWYGVPLKSGLNTLTASAIVDGVAQTLKRNLTVASRSDQLILLAQESRLFADGRSMATLQGKLLDKDGNLAQDESFVTLAASDGLLLGEDASPSQPGFQVKLEQGQFFAQLQSPRQAGTVRVRATTATLEAYTEIQFATEQRPGIVAGVADVRLGKTGLNFHDRLKDFDVTQEQAWGVESSGQIFAMGSLGSWLFTGAYSSDRSLNEDCNCNNSLYDTNDGINDQFYAVRGDSSRVDKLTPSIDHFYIRLERTPDSQASEPDYLMWGDYGTTEWSRSSQQFTAVTRQLHGAKLNYNFGQLQVSGLFANQIEGFQRDVIAPNGTSGLYFLSKRQLVSGSEDVFLELEPLERPGTVVRRVKLKRSQDYEIDYDRGTVRFREPILRTDTNSEGEILVQRIISTYQFDGDSNTHLYAARAQYHLDRSIDHESWVGVTAVREDKGDRNFQLYGADTQLQLGDRGRLTAEYAQSRNSSSLTGQNDSSEIKGQAYRIEAEASLTEVVSGRGYFRHTDSGFSNNATVSFVPGQTRYGAEAAVRLGRDTKLNASYDHEKNKGTPLRDEQLPEILTNASTEAGTTATTPVPLNQQLTTVSAGVQQQLGRAKVKLDVLQRDRKDRSNPERSSQSTQLRGRVEVPIGDSVTLNALNQTTLSEGKDAVYTDRTQVGVDWIVTPGITLGVNQHWFNSGAFQGESFTTVDLSGDYALGSDTQLTGRYAILSGINGMMGQGAVGIQHRWEVSPGLNLDFAYERGIGNWRNSPASSNDRNQPPSVTANSVGLGLQPGNSMSVGLEYTGNPDWKASASYERSDTSGSGRSNVAAAVTGKLSPALTGLLRFNHQQVADARLVNLGPSTELRVGLAYREINSDRLNALFRYEYRRNPGTIPETILLGSGTGSTDHVAALEAIYAPSWRWEFYGKAALRYSESQLSRETLGSSTTLLTQFRATYRFHDSFDLGAEARWIGQSGGYQELGWVLEGGYFLTPDLRLSAGYVFGEITTDRDFDGNQAASGPYLGVTVKVNELFGGFGEQEPREKTQPVSN